MNKSSHGIYSSIHLATDSDSAQHLASDSESTQIRNNQNHQLCTGIQYTQNTIHTLDSTFNISNTNHNRESLLLSSYIAHDTSIDLRREDFIPIDRRHVVVGSIAGAFDKADVDGSMAGAISLEEELANEFEADEQENVAMRKEDEAVDGLISSDEQEEADDDCMNGEEEEEVAFNDLETDEDPDGEDDGSDNGVIQCMDTPGFVPDDRGSASDSTSLDESYDGYAQDREIYYQNKERTDLYLLKSKALYSLTEETEVEPADGCSTYSLSSIDISNIHGHNGNGRSSDLDPNASCYYSTQSRNAAIDDLNAMDRIELKANELSDIEVEPNHDLSLPPTMNEAHALAHDETYQPSNVASTVVTVEEEEENVDDGEERETEFVSLSNIAQYRDSLVSGSTKRWYCPIDGIITDCDCVKAINGDHSFKGWKAVSSLHNHMAKTHLLKGEEIPDEYYTKHRRKWCAGCQKLYANSRASSHLNCGAERLIDDDMNENVEVHDVVRRSDDLHFMEQIKMGEIHGARAVQALSIPAKLHRQWNDILYKEYNKLLNEWDEVAWKRMHMLP
eukprot:963921_1